METNNNIQAKAQAYAQEALKDQLDAVANAYIQGYNDAMSTLPRVPIDDGKDEFVDLGLDSRIMWATQLSHTRNDAFRSLGYYDALNYGIPTVEQFEEMFARCRYHSKSGYQSRSYVGPRALSVRIFFVDDCAVWVKSDVVNDEALACVIKADGAHEYVRTFVGDKLHILRVKE